MLEGYLHFYILKNLAITSSELPDTSGIFRVSSPLPQLWDRVVHPGPVSHQTRPRNGCQRLQIQCTNYHKFGNHLHGLNQSKSQIPRQITGTLPNSYTYKLLYTRATSLRRHWKLCLVEELTPKGFISGW